MSEIRQREGEQIKKESSEDGKPEDEELNQEEEVNNALYFLSHFSSSDSCAS